MRTNRRTWVTVALLAITLTLTTGAEGCQRPEKRGAMPQPSSSKIGDGGVLHPEPLQIPVPKKFKPNLISPEWQYPDPGESLEPHPQIDAQPVPFLGKQDTKDIGRRVEFWVSTNPLGGQIYIDWSINGDTHSEIHDKRSVWRRGQTVQRGDTVSITVTPVNPATRNALDLTCIITVDIVRVGRVYVDDDQVWGREHPRPCNARGTIP